MLDRPTSIGQLSPSELNDVARLVMVAESCGSQFLNDPHSFDEVLGRDRFAGTDRKDFSTPLAASLKPREIASASLGSDRAKWPNT